MCNFTAYNTPQYVQHLLKNIVEVVPYTFEGLQYKTCCSLLCQTIPFTWMYTAFLKGGGGGVGFPYMKNINL